MDIPLLKFAKCHGPECFKFDSSDISCNVTSFEVLIHNQIDGQLYDKLSLRILLDLNQLITLQDAFIHEERQVCTHVRAEL